MPKKSRPKVIRRIDLVAIGNPALISIPFAAELTGFSSYEIRRSSLRIKRHRRTDYISPNDMNTHIDSLMDDGPAKSASADPTPAPSADE